LHVLVFRHVPFEHLGLIAGSLQRHVIEPVYVDLPKDPETPLSISAAAGVILMGGPMSANDDLPYIRQELRFIAQAVAYRKAVLGICLGAQLLAKALGASVYRNPVKEIGWFPINFTEIGAEDPLFHGLNREETVFQWHGETFDLPSEARLLATSGLCRNQAFRIADRAYGLQFHLETTPEMISGWLREDANCADARELTTPVDPYAHAARQKELAGIVFDRWCTLLKRS
jgi:GMP synthase-like glutamine amidotransferase